MKEIADTLPPKPNEEGQASGFLMKWTLSGSWKIT